MPFTSRRSFSLTGYEVALTSPVSDSGLVFIVETTVGLTAPMVLTVNPESPASREVIRVGQIVGSQLICDSSADRGLRGSIGGVPHAHDTGDRMRATFPDVVLDDLFTDVEDLGTLIDTHDVAADPHAQYVLHTEHTGPSHDGLNVDAGTLNGRADNEFVIKTTEWDPHIADFDNHDGSTDGHPVVTTGADGIMSSADKQKLDGISGGAAGNQTIVAGNALSGGGSTDTVTLHHSDTSSQGSVNNSNGVVIQDVTLDGYGHVTGLGSVNLDSRYALAHSHPYLPTTGGTLTGGLVLKAGSESSPSLKFPSMGNEGVYAPNAHEISFAYDGYRTLSVLGNNVATGSGRAHLEVRGSNGVPVNLSRPSVPGSGIFMRFVNGSTTRTLTWDDIIAIT